MTITPVTNEQAEQQPQRPASRNIFEDPAIAAAAQNDPFARWIITNWRSVAVSLVAIAAGMLGYNRYTTVGLEKRAAATAVLSGVQESYNSLVSKEDALATLRAEELAATDAAEKEKLKGKIDEASREVDKLKDRVTLMVDALDAAPPYSYLKNLYQGLLAARLKNYDKTQSILAQQSWEQIGKPDSSERFVGELLTYGLARSLIDSDAHQDVARSQLAALAERGSFVAVQSANTLLLIARSDADKQQAAEIVAKLKVKFPAQQRFLTNTESE